MSEELSRRSLLKLAGAASAAGLTVGVIDPPKAEAATLVVVDAVIDFGHRVNRVMIKAVFDGIPASTSTADFLVQVTLTDLREPGAPPIYSGANPPDAVR